MILWHLVGQIRDWQHYFMTQMILREAPIGTTVVHGHCRFGGYTKTYIVSVERNGYSLPSNMAIPLREIPQR